MPKDDINIVDDLNEDVDTSQPSTTADDQPTDVRSLLQKAMKETGQEDQPEENGGRARNADGTFAPKTEQQQAPEGQQQDTTQPQEGAQQPQDPNAVDEAVIAKLPENVRDEVRTLLTTRDTAFNQYAQKLHDQLNGYGAIEQLIAPRRDAWALNGLAPDVAVRQLFALSDFAGRDPREFIKWMAGQHSIDLTTIADDGDYDGDPALRQVLDKVGTLEQQLQQRDQQQQQTYQQQQEQQLAQQITQFATEKDSTGNPVRPYFDQVVNDVMMLIPGIKAANPQAAPTQVLQDAYDRAVWANPVTRGKMNEAVRLKEARERATNARKAGSSITGGPSGEVPAAQIEAGSVRDALKMSFEAHR